MFSALDEQQNRAKKGDTQSYIKGMFYALQGKSSFGSWSKFNI